MEVVNYKDIEKEAKKRERKEKVKEFKTWCKDNPELAVIVFTGATGGAVAGIKGIIALAKALTRSANLRKQQKLRDLNVYDTSLGHYWNLKRKLSNSEWLLIEYRRKNGERLADILDDLNVLA